MYLTIFKVVWPLLERLLAKQAAQYLEDRREGRRKTSEDSDCPPCPPADMPVVAETDASSGDSIWFALSGILLGSAFSLMLYVMLQDDKAHLQP